MDGSFNAPLLPLQSGIIDQANFLNELIDATAKLEVYKEKIRDSKLNASWFMPTLQQKEALASSALEGTQATLDGVLINQVNPNDRDKNLNEVSNYYSATILGYDILRRHDFSNDFFFDIQLFFHAVVIHGIVHISESICREVSKSVGPMHIL